MSRLMASCSICGRRVWVSPATRPAAVDALLEHRRVFHPRRWRKRQEFIQRRQDMERWEAAQPPGAWWYSPLANEWKFTGTQGSIRDEDMPEELKP